MKKREAFKYPLIGSYCHGEAVCGLTKSRAFNMIGYGSIWLSPVGSKLEAGANFRNAVSYWSSPDCLGPMATEAIVKLPRLTAAGWGSEFYFMYGLAIIHLYIQFSQWESSKTLAQNFMTKLYCQFLNTSQVI